MCLCLPLLFPHLRKHVFYLISLPREVRFYHTLPQDRSTATAFHTFCHRKSSHPRVFSSAKQHHPPKSSYIRGCFYNTYHYFNRMRNPFQHIRETIPLAWQGLRRRLTRFTAWQRKGVETQALSTEPHTCLNCATPSRATTAPAADNRPTCHASRSSTPSGRPWRYGD